MATKLRDGRSARRRRSGWVAMVGCVAVVTLVPGGLVVADDADLPGGSTTTTSVPAEGDEAAPTGGPGVSAPAGPSSTTTVAGEVTAAADGELSLVKTASRSIVRPGEELEYRITAACSSLTSNCVDFTVVDVLPAEFDVTSLPQSNSQREVTFDAGTRTLTVRYRLALPGTTATGLPAGASQSFAVGMRLPRQTPVLDGQVVPNTATASAVDFPDASGSVDVAAEIPVRLDPVATKTWAPAAAIAQSGAASQITLGVRNASTSSAVVNDLRVTDATPATWERFDLVAPGTVLRFPNGADQVVVDVCTTPIATPCALDSDWTSSSAQTGPDLTLPDGVDAGTVTAVRYRFSASGGAALPYDATPAQVRVDVRLRDTYRTSGAAITPTSNERISNCATPSLVAVSGVATGTDACTPFTIQPDSVTVGATKTMYSDPTGSYTSGGVVVVGQDSGVSMRIAAQNNAAFAVPIMRIVEPSPSVVTDWDKLTVERGRFTFPAGATIAKLTVDCRTGADPAPTTFTRPPSPTTVTLASLGCAPGVGAASVAVEFTGYDAGTSTPLIAIGASGVLELNGAATGATMADVADGGLLNCAQVFVASQIDSTGAATADACATTAVEAPRASIGSATKSSDGVYTITPGQDLKFTLSFRNRGNIPVANVVLVDPPNPTAANNPFGKVRLTNLRATTATPASTLEVYDPTVSAYVPFVASDTALLERATGIRVTVNGNLAVNQTFSLDYTVRLRDGQPVGTSFRNCAAVGIDEPNTASPFCLPSTVTNGVPGSGASLNKSIVPPTVVRPKPGLAPQNVTVKHRAQNTGTLYLKQLIITDVDADFFDAVTFAGSIAVNFPKGANRVRVDVCTSVAACALGTWVVGTRTSSSTPSIPTGVATAAVKGIRFVFENSNNGFEILPSPNFPSTGRCTDATVCFQAEVREFLASAPTTKVPDQLADTSSGEGVSALQAPGTTFAIPEVTATADIVQGTPKLDIDKSPDSRIGPGDDAPVSVVVTNTGTDAVSDPRVVDPLPALLTFDPVVNGAPAGQPYLLDYVLPTGVAPPTTVEFTTLTGADGVPGCTDADRVCALAWSFPGWTLPPGGKIRISFDVTLTPGVTAGQVITNRAGASGSNPDLVCSATSVVDDPALGAGRYCTDTATVTVLAGDDFVAQKWVAADPSLGFRDATGAVVPVSSSECPRYVSGGTVYTRFPCTARVLPGRPIEYLIRGVNSGTNPATQVVIVDGLPVAGDTGVLLSGQQRGTQWSNRPTVLTPVASVDRPAALVTGYATASFPGGSFCTADLAAPPSSCPAGAFAAAAGPTTTGFRSVLTFPADDLLDPGESFTISWTMRAPTSLTSTENEPVAWNSFAYRPTFKVGSGTSTLPATEPIKVGVGMPLGSFTVTKQVDGLPAGIPLDPFELAWSCIVVAADDTIDTVGSGTFTLVDGETFTAPQLPKGAECSVWETDAQGGQSPNIGEANAVSLIIDSTPGPQHVDIVNSYDTGSLHIAKQVVWDVGVTPVTLPDPFVVNVDCGFPELGDTLPGFPRTILLADGEASSITDLPVGTACVVEETDRQGAISTTMSPSNGEPIEGDTVLLAVAPDTEGGTALGIENLYETGGIELVKVLDGDASQWAQGPFVFDITCTKSGMPTVAETVTLQPEQLTTVISPIPAGYQCTVVETGPGDAASSVVSPAVVTIPEYPVGAEPPGPVLVTATNSYPAGSLSVSKVLAGDAAGPMVDAEFTLQVLCERTLVEGDGVQTIVDESVTLKGGATVTLPDALPMGARCWVVETDSVGATQSTVTHGPSNKVVIGSPTADVTITATNTYVPGGTVEESGEGDESGIEITKVLTGSAAPWALGPFEIEVDCVLGGYALPTYEVTLTPTERVAYVNPVPVGAVCEVIEVDNGSAPGAGPVSAGTVTVPAADEPAVEISVVNDFPGASLVVEKQAIGGGVGATFDFTVACTSTPDSGPAFAVDLSGDDGDGVTAASFGLKSGEQRSFTVPVGSLCSVTETDDGGATTTSYTVSNGDDHEAVTVDSATSVEVTNTFAVMPEAGSSSTMLLLRWASALLAAGAAAVLLGRRRWPRPAPLVSPNR